MNLLELRKKVIEVSGRYDLIGEEFSDNGIDFYIMAGMRYLDDLVESQKDYAHFYKYLLQGEWNIQIPYCKSIHAVYISSQTEKWRLEKKDLDWLVLNCYSELASQLDQGPPIYYATVATRMVGTKPPSLSYYMDYIVPTSNEYNAIALLPITNSTLMLDVIGKFYSTPLTKNEDSNFWTEVYPSTLVKAACREIEIYNQNQSKTTAWTNTILQDLDGINKNLVDEDSAEIDQMEG